MHTFAELIEELGGAADVAAAMGEPVYPGLVRQWKARGNIPPAYWPKIIEYAEIKGLTGVNEGMLGKLAIGADQRRVPASKHAAA
jgi:hypothetical protein